MAKGTNRIEHASMGQTGGTYIGQTGTPVLPLKGVWGVIHCITNTKFTALKADAKWSDYKHLNTDDTGGAAAGTQLTDAISFPAGTILYGRWTSVTLHTGTAIAYSIN